MKKAPKLRLDQFLLENKFFESREKAQAAILAGEVWSQEKRLDKPGTMISSDTTLTLKSNRPTHVSRAGTKLEFAIQEFKIDVQNKIALDIGASTGGFTDCLLKKGAPHVFSVDVGYGQLDVKLREDARVTCVERTNARHLKKQDLESLSELAKNITFAVMDVSFISLSKIIPQIKSEFPTIKEWVLLFKPQFEVGRENLKKGGIVKSSEIALAELEKFVIFLENLGLKKIGSPLLSPIEGKKSGNQEYLLYVK